MSMKDLLSKMTELQGTVESTETEVAGTKVLNESTGVTDYAGKKGVDRKEALKKYANSKDPKDAEAARKAGASQTELKQAKEVKESKPTLKGLFNTMLSETENYTTRPAADGTVDIVNQKGQRVATTPTNKANDTITNLKTGQLAVPGSHGNKPGQPNQQMNEVEDEIDSNEYDADVYDGDDYDHDDGSDQYSTELYGLHLGDVVKANYNGKTVIGKINELYPTNMEVELELTGRNAGKTIVVDVRDTEYVDNLNEGLAPAQKQKLKSLIYAYRDATDPFGSEYDLDPSVVIDQIRQEFGAKIADTISQGPSMHFPRPGHVSGVYDPLANKSSPRVTKLGKINRQDAETMKRSIKQQHGMTESKLNEKAKSKVQQKAAGAALAAKRGDTPKSKLKGASKEMAKMSTKELEKFAKTKHKGLPEKKESMKKAADDATTKNVAVKEGRLPKVKVEKRLGKYAVIDDGEVVKTFIAKYEADEHANYLNDKKAAADKQKVTKMKKTNEAKAKPDYIDLDKDGNKTEPMKKAAADKKKKAVNEISTDTLLRARNKASGLAHDAENNNHYTAQSARLAQADKFQQGINDRLKKEKDRKEKESLSPAQRRKLGMMEGANPSEAARLLGKAHAMGKDPFACKYEEGSPEAQAYLDGYKEGLDECYGSGGSMAQNMSQDIGMMPGMDAMVSVADTQSPRGGSEFEIDDTDSMGGFGGFDSQPDEADMMAFEAWDRELNELLNEGKMKEIDIDMQEMSDAEFKKEHGKSKADMKKDLSGTADKDKKNVKEGISVSVSKGQQGSPDSVTVSAQDSDADALLAMIKQAGLGLFGGEEPSGYGAPTTPQMPSGDVGDHDSMMALIKQMTTGGSSSNGDYEDEESQDDEHVHGHPDAACDVCGSSDCGCDDSESDSKALVVGEEESEDQEEFEVAEAADSDEAETTADEDAEAEEDKALAGADSDNEEEIDEDSNSDYPMVNGKKVDERSIQVKGGSWQDSADTYATYAEFTDGTELSEEELEELSQDGELMNQIIDQRSYSLNEWANDAGYEGGENTKDNTFEQDIEFMTRVISGGLNNEKKDQTTLPHTRVKVDESRQAINDWKKLSGIK
jgi:hypothetical protein